VIKCEEQKGNAQEKKKYGRGKGGLSSSTSVFQFNTSVNNAS
jgi:hypothetical protein